MWIAWFEFVGCVNWFGLVGMITKKFYFNFQDQCQFCIGEFRSDLHRTSVGGSTGQAATHKFFYHVRCFT